MAATALERSMAPALLVPAAMATKQKTHQHV